MNVLADSMPSFKEMFETFKEILYWLANEKWLFLAYWMPFVFILIWFYFKNKSTISNYFLNLILWMKPSMETNGKASSEKLTAFAVTFVYIISRMVYTFKIIDPIHLLYGFCVDAAFILILDRIITPQQLLELKSGINTETSTSTKTETTTSSSNSQNDKVK